MVEQGVSLLVVLVDEGSIFVPLLCVFWMPVLLFVRYYLFYFTLLHLVRFVWVCKFIYVVFEALDCAIQLKRISLNLFLWIYTSDECFLNETVFEWNFRWRLLTHKYQFTFFRDLLEISYASSVKHPHWQVSFPLFKWPTALLQDFEHCALFVYFLKIVIVNLSRFERTYSRCNIEVILYDVSVYINFDAFLWDWLLLLLIHGVSRSYALWNRHLIW